MTEQKTKYPAIAILLADGTQWHQVTGAKDAELFDLDAAGKVTGAKRAMPRVLAICKQYGWMSDGLRMHKSGTTGLAVIEAED